MASPKFAYFFFVIVTFAVCITRLKGQSCDGLEPCVPLDTANQRFESCCQNAGLDECTKYCNYDTEMRELKRAILTTKECQLYQMQDFLKCAADNKDNTGCCEESRVLDGAREVCDIFCNPNSDDWPASRDGAGKYLKCLSKFKQIMKCHHASLRP